MLILFVFSFFLHRQAYHKWVLSSSQFTCLRGRASNWRTTVAAYMALVHYLLHCNTAPPQNTTTTTLTLLRHFATLCPMLWNDATQLAWLPALLSCLHENVSTTINAPSMKIAKERTPISKVFSQEAVSVFNVLRLRSSCSIVSFRNNIWLSFPLRRRNKTRSL